MPVRRRDSSTRRGHGIMRQAALHFGQRLLPQVERKPHFLQIASSARRRLRAAERTQNSGI
jgi:hypothetical protein